MVLTELSTPYCGIFSSVVLDQTEPPGVSVCPLGDIVHFSIYDQPLVIPVVVSLHLLPGEDTCRVLLSATAHLLLLLQERYTA